MCSAGLLRYYFHHFHPVTPVSLVYCHFGWYPRVCWHDRQIRSNSCGSIPLFLAKSSFFPFFGSKPQPVATCSRRWFGSEKPPPFRSLKTTFVTTFFTTFQVMMLRSPVIPSPGWFVATSRFCQQFTEPLGGPWSALRWGIWFHWNMNNGVFHQPKCDVYRDLIHKNLWFGFVQTYAVH